MFRPSFCLGVALVVGAPGAACANHYRIYFQGTDAVALQSAAVPAAGYLGTAPPPPSNNLSATCPTCVPGGTASANYGAGVPNQIVTFLHPYTGQAITVPLTLPTGRPTVVTKSDRIVYNYGLFGYKVVVLFLPNGRAEVRYRD